MIYYNIKIDPSEPPEIPEESLTCDICGQILDTVESFKEHNCHFRCQRGHGNFV